MLMILVAVLGLSSASAEAGKRETSKGMRPTTHRDRPITGVNTEAAPEDAVKAKPVLAYDPDLDAANEQALAPQNPPTSGGVSPTAAAGVVNSSFFGMQQVPSNQLGWGYPPDTSLAASSSRVVQAVNRRVRLSNTTGGHLMTMTLDGFFKGVDGLQLFDPKVYYDRNSSRPRHYIVALEGASSGFSRLHLAVSRSTDPSTLAPGAWCRYSFDARVPVAGNAATWADYPGLGMGQTALTLSTNQFSDTGSFRYTALWALNKLQVSNNASACPSISRYNWKANATLGDFSRFTVQPVQHYTNPSSYPSVGVNYPAYFVNTLRGTGSYYRVWRIINIGASSPLLQSTFVYGNFSYSIPPRGPGGQNPSTGAAATIDNGDTRVLQGAGLGNHLYAAHGTGCQFTGGAVESCARYVAIDVGTATNGAMTVALRQQATNGGGDGWYYSYPGVAVNNNGAVASAFVVESVGGYQSSAYGTKTYTQANFPSESFLLQGTCLNNATYQADRGYNRAGDYTGAQTAPDGTSFWVSAERATAISGVGCGWQTLVARVSA
ncbi:MAG: hypothetical protein WKF43_02855 [Acidimicrobiales bacterium]